MGGLTRGLVRLVLLVMVAFAVASPSDAARSRAHLRGVVPHAKTVRSLPKSAAAAAFLTFDAGYETLVDQYFTDVAHDSGGTANVYSIGTQYFDTGYAGSGPVQYQSAFGGAYVDRDPLPANGCDDGSDPVCLTDAQLQAEIQSVLTTNGWHGGLGNIFFLLTPEGVGSCGDGFGAECSSNSFCAYHSDFTDSAGEPVIYANEPYEGGVTGCVGPGQGFPNDVDADTTINTISHEHNESITDPLGDGWVDSQNQENGDLCAYTYGPALGAAPNGQPYNQLINGHVYSLQQEYSDTGSTCLQNSTQEHGGFGNKLPYNDGKVMHTNTTYAIYWLPTPGNAQPPAVSGTAAVNQTLTSSPGAWNGSPKGYSYQWERCSAASSGCTAIPNATGQTYTLVADDGGRYVRSTVSATNVNGASPYTASAGQVVAPLPAATGSPVLSGVPAVGKKLSTTSGAWNTAATFAYQWLRCSAAGTDCSSIAGTRSATYVVAAADAGHRLEARVFATNIVGSAQASSNLSGVVIPAPRLKTAPHISGRARVGKPLSTTRGSWSGSPKSYRYQWLRCNAHGSACRIIRHATKARYRLTKLDAKHRIRVRVTAVNAAGRKLATSRPTPRVPA